MTVLVAVGSGNVNVPDITGKTASEADKVLRDKQLTLGQASPTGADPEGARSRPRSRPPARSSSRARR